MLRRWMANDPKILGSDIDVLEAIKDGDCDVGLTNSYYLGRELADDPNFPVAPVWADQNGRGTHVNLSGLGVVKGVGPARTQARELMEFLREPQPAGDLRPEQPRVPAVAGREARPGDGALRRPSSATRSTWPAPGRASRRRCKLMDEVGWD